MVLAARRDVERVLRGIRQSIQRDFPDPRQRNESEVRILLEHRDLEFPARQISLYVTLSPRT